MKGYFSLFLFALLLLLMLLRSAPLPSELYVEKVIDGDTFRGGGYTVRLLGIDAPEKGQPCYEQAKNFLKRLVEGKRVRVEYGKRKKDRYGRLLAYVWVNGTFVNRELVLRGFAVFRSYGERLKYEKLLNLPPSGCVATIDTCEECIGISYFEWNPPGNDCEGSEFVKLKNFCAFPCNLTGWRLRDKEGNEFVFSGVVIERELYIYSGCGKNEKNKIYLCPKRACKAVWNNEGDSFILMDRNNRIVINYTYGGGHE